MVIAKTINKIQVLKKCMAIIEESQRTQKYIVTCFLNIMHERTAMIHPWVSPTPIDITGTCLKLKFVRLVLVLIFNLVISQQ